MTSWKKIFMFLVLSYFLFVTVFSVNGCGVLPVASITAAGTTLGGMDVWVFVPAAGARNIIVKSASKNTPKVLPPSGYTALSGATLSVVGYNKTATTNSDGYAYLGGLADGSYTVTVGKDGYETFTYFNVSVSTGLVTNVGGSSGIQSQTSSAPGILDLSAYKGPVGIPITITGSNFGSTQGTSTVTVAGYPSPASIVSWSDTRIVFTLPANVPVGAVGLTVTVGSTISNSMPFTVILAGTTGYPNIIGISPITGQRGTSVTITGTNFGSSQGSSVVSFSGNTANSITSWSDTSIVCSAPYTTIDGGVVVAVNGISSNALSFAAGSWSAMSSTGTTNSLRAVWGTASNNVYAVGGNATIINYNGSSWNSVTIPGDMGPTQQLNSIWGTSASNIYVAGNSGKFWQYNGSWLSIALPEVGTSNINCIWGFSANDVFAVGHSGKIRHYDGTSWSKITFPPEHLRGVWGTASDDVTADNVFAVGDSAKILHYDGHVWSAMTPPSGFTTQLNSVWGSDVNNVFAVGQSGKVLHYNGTLWSEMNSGTEQNLNSVWGTASNNVYAVGGGGTILYYNGTSGWAPMTSPTLNSLRGIWGSSVSDIFAVGDSGTILHYTQ